MTECTSCWWCSGQEAELESFFALATDGKHLVLGCLRNLSNAQLVQVELVTRHHAADQGRLLVVHGGAIAERRSRFCRLGNMNAILGHQGCECLNGCPAQMFLLMHCRPDFVCERFLLFV